MYGAQIMNTSSSSKRTAETDAHYDRVYEMLANQTSTILGLPDWENVGTLNVAEHLMRRRPKLAKRTWQLYRRAIIAHLELYMRPESDPYDRHDAEYVMRWLMSFSQNEALKRGTQGPSLKTKTVSPERHSRFMSHLRSQRPSKWAALAEMLCEATLMTGLRPSEWATAKLLRSKEAPAVLRVTNAKATQGRANGQFRNIVLDGMSNAELSMIENMLASLARFNDRSHIGANDAIRRVSRYLYTASKKCFPTSRKAISLYSYRHQFAANAKQAGLTKAEVAALMGHGSDETAGRNYARRVSGRGGIKVSAQAAEVAKVREIARPYGSAPSRGPR